MTNAANAKSISHPLRSFDAMEEYRRLREEDLRAFQAEWQKPGAKVSRDCVACGSKNAVPHFHKDGFDFVRCAECACIYVNPVPNAKLLDWYYDKSSAITYFYEHILKPSLPRRRPIFDDRVKQLLAYIPAGARVLEVGSNIGLFVEAAKKAGLDVHGIEPNAELAASTSKTYNVPVANCFVEDFETDQLFDAVVIWEVIEHMTEPAPIVQKLRKLLKPGGILAMTLPNVAGIEFGLCGAAHEMIEAPSHINYYTPETLSLLLTKNGFSLETLTTPGILDYANVVNHLRRFQDAEAVDKTLWPASENAPSDIGGAFLLWLQQHASDEERAALDATITSVIQRNKSSGNMFVVARAA